MIRPIFALVLLGFVAGCAATPQVITSTKEEVVQVPDALYVCPTVTQFPNAKTLTDQQVAQTLVQLQTNNLTCKNSLVSIKDFLNKTGTDVKKIEK